MDSNSIDALAALAVASGGLIRVQFACSCRQYVACCIFVRNCVQISSTSTEIL